ncbi:hypothetical protein RI129_005961 [Pyrocoelia pectoralis]|uniref:Major facilitator superfamily (MFS) profile domain-containing protein n=1 Tax=Pyrocoelia pectoralis TaxID=417401 RepID=A0AAN7ZP25_9COLE
MKRWKRLKKRTNISEPSVVGYTLVYSHGDYNTRLLVSLGAVCAGTGLAWTSPVLPQIQMAATNVSNITNLNLNETILTNLTQVLENVTQTLNSSDSGVFKLTESEGSLVGSMLAIGALFSAIPGGYIADRIGRRNVNILIAIPYILNWLLIVFATGPMMLYIARFFAGLATGAVCVTAPMYIGEIAEVSVRGTLGSFFQMFLCFGIFLTYLVGALLSWVGLSWVLLIIPILFAIAMYFMPDTPIYLIKCGRRSEAEKSLRYFRGPDHNLCTELKVIEANIAKGEEKKAGLKDLVASRGNRKAMISALGLMLFQQMSGINAVIFYTVPIFHSAGTSMSADVAAVTVSIVQFIIAYVAAMIIDKHDRRFYLMLSSIGMMVCLAALGLYFHLKVNNITFAGLGMLPLGSLVLFIVSFSLGFGPIPWMILSELLAPEIKGVGSGIAVMTNWLLVFVVTFSFPLMNSGLGGHITFYIFAVILLIGTAFVYYYVPETKGKTLNEIQLLLNK